MANIEEVKTFSGGMNKDDDPRFLPDGDYTDALNLTSKIVNGTGGVLISQEGNVEVDMYLSVDVIREVSSVNIGTDTITTSAPHLFYTGVAVYYETTSATVINGLTRGDIYYVIRISSTEFQLATTEANAIAGTQIDLTSDGSLTTNTFTLRFALPAGTNTVVGCTTDLRSNQVYYFIHNSNNRHTILRYNEAENRARLVLQDNSWFVGFSPWYSLCQSSSWGSGTTYDMLDIVEHNGSYYVSLQDSNLDVDPEGADTTTTAVNTTPIYTELYWKKLDNYLNFPSATTSITGIETFEYDGDTYLSWTDGSNEPKMINVDRAMAYGAANRYAPMEPEYTNLYANTPQYIIKSAYQSDYDIDGNTVGRKMFQFRYRWRYRNGEVSAMSPISKVPLPIDNVASGQITTANNKIRLKIPVRDNYNNAATNTGWLSEVESVEVFYRDNGTNNTGSWYNATTIKINDATIRSPQVFNATGPGAVVNKLNVGTDRLAVGDPVQYNSSGADIGGLTSGTVYYITLPQRQSLHIDYVALATSIRNALNGTFIPLTAGGYFATHTVTTFYDAQDAPFWIEYDFSENAASVAIDTLEANLLYDFIPRKAKALTLSNSNRLNFGNVTNGYDFDVSNLDITVSLNPSTTENGMAVSGFKSGSYHKFGIVYSDAQGRLSTIYTNENCLFYIPYPNSLNTDSNWLKINIGHAPPSWATHYHIVWSGNQSKSNYIQFVGAAAATPAGKTNIRTVVMKSVTDLNDEADTSNINYNYSFTEGDIIVPIKEAGSSPSPDVYYRDIGGTDEVDYSQVLEFDSATNTVTFDIDGWKTFGASGDVYEIYSPANISDTSLWYEIGDAYRLGFDENGALAHNAYNGTSNSQNQKIGVQDAVVVAQAGDCYMFGIGQWIDSLSTPYPVYGGIEARYSAPLYGPVASSIGRPNVVNDSFAEVNYETEIDYTEPFLDNTNFFGVSRAYDSNFVDNLNQSYGDIQLLHSYGDFVICIQKTSTSSILSNKYYINTADLSSSLIGQTQSPLSEPQYLSGKYGTSNPESFAFYGNVMFWVDTNSGSVIRCDGRSMEDISQIKMSNFFEFNLAGQEVKSLKSLPSTNEKIYGVYSVKDSEYIASFIGLTPTTVIASGTENSSLRTYTFSDLDVERSYLSNAVSVGVVYAKSDNVSTYSIIKGTISGSGSNTINVTTADLGGTSVFTNIGITDILIPTMTTIAFNNERNRWTSLYSYQPEQMGRTSVGVVTFKNGVLYRHIDDPYYDNALGYNVPNWNHFYGTTYDSKVEFALNKSPMQVKVPLAINVESNQAWSMPYMYNETINQEPLFYSLYGKIENQITELALNDFEIREGQYWSHFFRNKYSPNETYPLLDGEEMRGAFHIVLLQTTPNTLLINPAVFSPQPRLFSVTALQLYSPIS